MAISGMGRRKNVFAFCFFPNIQSHGGALDQKQMVHYSVYVFVTDFSYGSLLVYVRVVLLTLIHMQYNP